MIKKVLLATSNQHKLTEVRALFAEFLPEWEVIGAESVGERAVDENGLDYATNSYLKAAAYADTTDGYVLGEDSGVEVAALPGLLGVYSHRWHPGTDADRCQALLEKLQGSSDRRAKYVAVACLLRQGEEPLYFRGELLGEIALAPRGETGFGYDPLFIPQGYQQTLGELGEQVKNQISHRQAAIRQVIAYLSGLSD